MIITHFKNLDWIVAWDEVRQSHCYLKGSDLAFKGKEITYVCQTYQGASDRTIDGAGLCLIPGFVNIHSHPCTEALYRGIREDHSVREHHMTGLYERSCAFGAHDDDKKYAAEASYADLMLSGVTTLVDVTFPYPGWVNVMEKSGPILDGTRARKAVEGILDGSLATCLADLFSAFDR